MSDNIFVIGERIYDTLQEEVVTVIRVSEDMCPTLYTVIDGDGMQYILSQDDASITKEQA